MPNLYGEVQKIEGDERSERNKLDTILANQSEILKLLRQILSEVEPSTAASLVLALGKPIPQ